jgi:hypothetical protein
MTVTVIGVQSPDAEQRISSAFSLIFGAADLSPEGISNVAPVHERKDERPAIEKTIEK